MFIIIATSIFGTLINRKTNKVKVTKTKTFIPFAIVSIAINYLAGIYMLINATMKASGFNGADSQSGIVELLVFIVILAISILPAL